jgi:hypothetical protein
MNKFINIGLDMGIIKQQIKVSLTKTELVDIIQEALASENNSSIKRALNPVLQDKFPQFPEFTQISLGNFDENGQIEVVLKQQRQVEETTNSTDAEDTLTSKLSSEISRATTAENILIGKK